MQALNIAAIGALNHLIQVEPWAQARLRVHSGAQVRIDAGPFVLNLEIDERGLFLVSETGLEPDVSITLPSDLPVRLLIDNRNLFSSVKLGGAADIAESLAFVLRNLRWDAEADLAQLLGDIPARRLARLAKALALAIQNVVGRVAQNISEYVVEESRLLSASRDITQFVSAVNILRGDVARLEKRISRL